ncbi:MAG: hypothetical protein ABI575_10215, partial [Oxalobacteraceae bacterium]
MFGLALRQPVGHCQPRTPEISYNLPLCRQGLLAIKSHPGPSEPIPVHFLCKAVLATMAAIQITQVEKRYKSLQALGGVSLSIEEGEFFG